MRLPNIWSANTEKVGKSCGDLEQELNDRQSLANCDGSSKSRAFGSITFSLSNDICGRSVYWNRHFEVPVHLGKVGKISWGRMTLEYFQSETSGQKLFSTLMQNI
jgi:hypothetical protein